MFVEVKESKFVRDTSSMALINKDNSARDEYYVKAKLLKTQKDEINNIKEDISSLKGDISELKTMLRQLLGKDANG
jgi:gluconate kinase